jgi:hypothetical protein
MSSSSEFKLTRDSVSLIPVSVIKYMIKDKGKDAVIPDEVIEADTSSIPFPTWIIDGFAKRFAVAYSKILEPGISAFYMSALTCLGSILAGKIRLNSQIPTDPRLYVIFIGESGAAKKSTAAIETIKFFRDNVRTFRVCQGAGSAEGLFNEINDVKWDRRMVLFYDEFQQFVNKCKIDSSVLLQMVNILFESNMYESPLKNSKMKLDNTYLTMLSASTEDTYDECWTSTFTNIGFNNRLFIIPISSKPAFSIPKMMSKETVVVLSDEMDTILGMINIEKIYDITPEGFAYYDKWYKSLKRGKYTIRIDTYALRFMPLLAANELKTVIDLAIVKKAIALCMWQIQVRKRYEPTVADNQYAAMEAKIRKILVEGPMRWRELQRKSHATRVGIRTFENAIDLMVKSREIYLGTDGMYRLMGEEI